MKSLRMLVLTLAVGVFPVSLMQAHGQQEVDPDHFDQPAAAKANVYTLKAQKNHHATAADHHVRKQESTATKRRQKAEPPSGSNLAKPVCGPGAAVRVGGVRRSARWSLPLCKRRCPVPNGNAV